MESYHGFVGFGKLAVGRGFKGFQFGQHRRDGQRKRVEMGAGIIVSTTEGCEGSVWSKVVDKPALLNDGLLEWLNAARSVGQ